MFVGESIRTSLEEVRAHPLRSAFTLVGVILGTLAIVVVMSVLDGVQAGWKGDTNSRELGLYAGFLPEPFNLAPRLDTWTLGG